MSSHSNPKIAVVAIGRNEGERLRLCLEIARSFCPTVVYVDSGSSDQSVVIARDLGCVVHELTPDKPFSAARGRNEGFAKLMEVAPETEFVQFLDGDCRLAPGWLEAAAEALAADSSIGIVRGHVVEEHPEASIYNTLTHLEWQQLPGEIWGCGGRFLTRTQLFRQIGGFRSDLIAEEDDEFCFRARAAGWRNFMLDVPMAAHDVNLHSFRGWWRRARRAGYGYAAVAALHGSAPERYFIRDRRKIWVWGLAFPLAALALAPFVWGASLAVLLLLYIAQSWHIRRGVRLRPWTSRERTIYAVMVTLSRFPGMVGLLEYYLRRGRPARIIEYH